MITVRFVVLRWPLLYSVRFVYNVSVELHGMIMDPPC